MSFYRYGVAGLAGLAIAVGGLTIRADSGRGSRQHDEQLSAMMRAKLAGSHKVMEGLVTEDFESIRRGASELARICEATEWAARKDQIYGHHRTELLRQSRKLAKMADEENLDGAAFTYLHTVTTCVSCHQYCRDVLRIADTPATTGKVVPIPVNEEMAEQLESRPVRR